MDISLLTQPETLLLKKVGDVQQPSEYSVSFIHPHISYVSSAYAIQIFHLIQNDWSIEDMQIILDPEK